MKSYAVIFFGFIILVFSVLNCTGVFPPNDPIPSSTLKFDKTLFLAYHDTLFNYEENAWITLDSLISDYRCPVPSECKWEGNAEFAFAFNSIGFHLNTSASFRRDTTLSGYHIELLYASPYPHMDSVYTAEQYVAEIKVSK